MSDKAESGGGPVNCSDSELCIFLAALGEGYCPTYYSDTSQSVQSKSMSIASRSYQLGKKTVSFHGFPYLRMSKNSMGGHGEASLMSSREDSPVKISVLPDAEPASTESAAGSGLTWPGSLARFDPASRSWRTAQPSLLGASEECSVIWPRSGMTVDGQCWELPMSARRTSVIGSGLWRTPTVSMLNADRARDPEYASRKVAKGQTITLADQVKNPVMWPTPRANDAEKRGDFDASNKRNGLPAAVKLWPTPVATIHKGSSQASLTRKSGADRSGDRLDHAVMASDGGQLNPAWAEWLMGWPPGWTSLAALNERECEYWQAANAAHGDGAPADELWFDEEAGAPSGDHGARQAIPRVCSGVQARAARLKAIGNGQVPRAAAMAWRTLVNILAELPPKTRSPVSVEI